MSVDIVAGLGRALSEHFGRDVAVENLTQSTAGARRQNLIFDAVDGDERRRLVATIVPTGEAVFNTITAEAAVRTVAGAAGVAVPEVLLATDDESYVGGSFMISEFVPGETVPRKVLRLVTDQGIGDDVARQIGESLGRLHSIPAADVPEGLRQTPQAFGVMVQNAEHTSTAAPENPARAALDGLIAAVDGLPRSRPVLELAFRWLERRLPPPGRRSLVHGDVRNGNIIVDETGLRAVLDWELAFFPGDPMEDLAWPAQRMWRGRNDELEIGGFASREPYIAGYESAGGIFEPERFEWWKVERTLWWAIGLAGQAMSFIDGRVPSIVMAASGRRVSELEWDLLMLIRPDGDTASA